MCDQEVASLINRISDKLAIMLAENNIISNGNIHIYSYGIELFLLKLLMYGILLFIGFLINTLLVTAIFTLVYITLREFTGGYHCSTPLRCITVSIVICLILAAGYQFGTIVLYKVMVWASAAAVVIIIVFSPIASLAKPISDKQFRQSRLISRYISILLFTVSVIFVFINIRYFSYPISFALLCDSFLLIIEKEKQKHEKNYS